MPEKNIIDLLIKTKLTKDSIKKILSKPRKPDILQLALEYSITFDDAKKNTRLL